MHHRLSFNSKLERFIVLGHFCRQLTLELSSTSKGAATIETPPCAGDTAGSETGSAGLLAVCGAGSAMSEVIVWASLLRDIPHMIVCAVQNEPRSLAAQTVVGCSVERLLKQRKWLILFYTRIEVGFRVLAPTTMTGSAGSENGG